MSFALSVIGFTKKLNFLTMCTIPLCDNYQQIISEHTYTCSQDEQITNQRTPLSPDLPIQFTDQREVNPFID